MKKGKKLEEVLPVYKIENDCLLSRRGDVTIAYEITLPEIFTLSNSDYEALHNAWIKAIRLLPTYTILHKQDYFIKANYKTDFTENDASFLSRASDRHFNERPYLNHKCFLYLTLRYNGKISATSLTSTLIKPTLFSSSQKGEGKEMEKFFDKAGQFIKILEDSSYIKTRQLTTTDLIGEEGKAGLLERYCFLLGDEDPPVIRDIQLTEEFKVGELSTQLFTLADVEDLPALCGPRINYDKYSTDKTKFSISFAAPLGLLLNCNHIYNQYILIEDSQVTLKKMESKRLRLQSLSAYSRENSLSRDAVNQFLNEAIAEQRLPVKAHFNILAWTENKNQVNEIRNEISSALAKIDARAKLETIIAPQLFFAGMPGAAGYLPQHDTFDTFAEQATCFFNQETNYYSSISPVGIRLTDRLTGIPVWVDLSDLPMKLGWITARNRFVLGPSGSGKSYWTNHFCRSYYEQGAHLVIIDVGHSYSGLCSLANGYYFTYDEKNPIKFNPFYLEPGDTLDTERKESIKTLLLALWKKDDESFKRSEYVALSNALTEYFKHLDRNADVFPCFDSFYEYIRDHYINKLSTEGVKEKDFDVENFVYVLKPFYKGGEFDYLLNATENLDLLQQRFIVFELDNIKDHKILFPAVTLQIMQIFISKMRKLKGVRKVILIEEAWKALMKEGFAEYIKYLFKTVRKFFGEAAVVTQEVEDIISSPIVKQAIINNSDCKVLLDQSKYQNKFQQIQELLGITEKQKAEILSMNKGKTPGRIYKDVWICLGAVSKVYGVEVSKEEHYCYTTEEREKIMVQEYARKYGDMHKGIAHLIQDMKATGQ